MHILCAKSGIDFTCEHFPGYLSSGEVSHPVFSLSQKKLLSYAGKWTNGGLTQIDSYLLFLALLDSTERVQWRTPAARVPEITDAIVAQNMDSLILTVCKLNAVPIHADIFPHFVIGPETKFLRNVNHWIEAWMEAHKEYQNAFRKSNIAETVSRRELALERMLKNPHRSIASYANQIAEWAAVAGTFPTFIVTPENPNSSITTPISCAEFWKDIIIKCCTYKNLPPKVAMYDLQDLIRHCEENIPPGSIYSHALFKVLRDTVKLKNNYLGTGDEPRRKTYEFLEESKDVEDINIKAMIASAPIEEPKIEQFGSKFEFMKAKMRWQMAKKYAPPAESAENSTSTPTKAVNSKLVF